MSREDDELFAVLTSVHDEETFLQFLLALRNHREASIRREKEHPSPAFGPDAMGWENTTIERFLDAAVAWALASDNGLPLAECVSPADPWLRCAEIFYAAIGYE